MGTRRETVELTLSGDFARKAVEAAAAAELLNRSIKGMSGSSTSSSGAAKSLENDMVRVTRSTEQSAASIDRYSGRLGLLAEAAVTLGPALVPLGAAAVTGIAGLTAGLGAAAGAFGVTLLAVHGLGDGLKALDAYQLEPTAANLQKLNDEMKKLGPAGADFVRYLDSIEPTLSSLQTTARQGMFPGFEDGIKSLMTRLPQVRDIISSLSTEVGNLAKDMGENLAGPKFDAFFTYLQQNAAPILHEFAQAAGNVGEGLANMLVAFTPLETSFSGGLLHMSQSFAQWSRTLDTNQSFQNFIRYVQESGPQVMAFIGALVSALSSIVEAAAPIGRVVLPILTEFLNIISAIAGSGFGTPIIASVAAFLALSRAVTIGTAALKLFGVAAATSATEAGGAAAALNPYVAGLAVLAGGILSVKNYNDQWHKSIDEVTASLGTQSSALSQRASQIALLQQQADKSNQFDTNTSALGRAGNALSNLPAAAVYDYRKLTGQQSVGQEQADAAYKAQAQINSVQVALGKLQMQMGGPDPFHVAHAFDGMDDWSKKFIKVQGGIDGNVVPSMAKLQKTADSVSPALDALGYSWEQFGADPAVQQRVASWIQSSDTAAGRTKALGSAVGDLDNQMINSAQSAQGLSTALTGLLGPNLDLSAATDAWTTALRHLNDDLNQNNKTLAGNSDAAIQNRSAVRDRVNSLTTMLTAEAAAGASSTKLSRDLEDQRGKLISAGQAAGISKQQMNQYLNTLGLTPKLVQTLVKANTSQASDATKAVQQQLTGIDKMIVDPSIKVQNNAALSGIAHVQAMLSGLHDRTVSITTVERTVKTGLQGAGLLGRAEGGPIYGPGTSTSDSILARLSTGEFVMKAAAVQRYGMGYMHDLNAMRFADGGSPSSPKPPTGPGGMANASWNGLGYLDAVAGLAAIKLSGLSKMTDAQLKAQARDLAVYGKQIAAHEKQVQQDADAAKTAYDNAKQMQQQFADSITQAFHVDPYSVQVQQVGTAPTVPDGGFTTLAASQAYGQQLMAYNQLQQQTSLQQIVATNAGRVSTLQEAFRLYKDLRSKGFDGPALRDLLAKGDVDMLRQIDSLPKAQLLSFENQFNTANRLERRLGQYAGNAEYGEATRAAQEAYKAQTAALHRVEAVVKEQAKDLKLVKAELAKQNKNNTSHQTGEAVATALKDNNRSNNQRAKAGSRG